MEKTNSGADLSLSRCPCSPHDAHRTPWCQPLHAEASGAVSLELWPSGWSEISLFMSIIQKASGHHEKYLSPFCLFPDVCRLGKAHLINFASDTVASEFEANSEFFPMFWWYWLTLIPPSNSGNLLFRSAHFLPPTLPITNDCKKTVPLLPPWLTGC